MLSKQLRNNGFTHADAEVIGELLGNIGVGEIRPTKIGFHRIASDMVLNHSQEGGINGIDSLVVSLPPGTGLASVFLFSSPIPMCMVLRVQTGVSAI